MTTQRGGRPRASTARVAPVLVAAAVAAVSATLLVPSAFAASPKATPKASRSATPTRTPKPPPLPPPPPIPVGTPPTAVVTAPSRIYAGIPVTLSGAASTASGGVSEWEWDLNGDGRYEFDSTSSAWISRPFGAGRHTVGLRVRNGTGLVGTTTKTLTVKSAPRASARPDAPLDVTATAGATTVTVRWGAPLGAAVLAYRVSNPSDQSSDPLFVPVSESRRAVFPNLVPGTYRVRVAAVNSAGYGPSTSAEVTVYPRGVASSSPSPTSAPATSVATGPATPSVPGASPTDTATASSSDGGGRNVLSIALVAGGIVLLLVAGAAALNARRRTP